MVVFDNEEREYKYTESFDKDSIRNIGQYVGAGFDTTVYVLYEVPKDFELVELKIEYGGLYNAYIVVDESKLEQTDVVFE